MSGWPAGVSQRPVGGTLTGVPPTPPPDRLAKPGGPAGAVAAAAAADAGGLDPSLLADYLEVLTEVAGNHRRLTRQELNRFRFQGRRAALEGVPMRALVELYLTAAWRLWRHLPVVRAATEAPEALVSAGEAVLRAIDEAVAAGVEGHQLARRELTRREEAARRELFDDLLSGRHDAAGLTSRAADFGLDLAGPHAVALISAGQPFVDGSPLVTRIESCVLGVKGDANALVASKEGLLVVIFAAPDAAAIDFVAERLSQELGAHPDQAAGSEGAGGAGATKAFSCDALRRSGIGRSLSGAPGPAPPASSPPTRKPWMLGNWRTGCASISPSSPQKTCSCIACCCATGRRSSTSSAPRFDR